MRHTGDTAKLTDGIGVGGQAQAVSVTPVSAFDLCAIQMQRVVTEHRSVSPGRLRTMRPVPFRDHSYQG